MPFHHVNVFGRGIAVASGAHGGPAIVHQRRESIAPLSATPTTPNPRRSPNKPMATTIKDVARAAGVSVATVSRALNGADNVTPDTRRRVVAVATAWASGERWGR